MQSRQDTDTKTRPGTSSSSVDRPIGSRQRHWFEPRRSWPDLFERLPFGFWAPPNGLTRPAWSKRGAVFGANWTPEIETFQKGDEFVVRADLPGLEKKDISVEVEGDELVIEGERSNEHDEEREGYFSSERTYGQFCRVVRLPDGAIPDSVKASFRNGVLEVVVKAPPQASSRARRIDIGDWP